MTNLDWARMDSPTAPPEPMNGHLESPNLQAIKAAFTASVDEGFEAGLEALLRMAHDDCEFRPYIAGGQVIRGHDEIRAYYHEALNSGTEMKMRPTSFQEVGDRVVVKGSMRVGRPSGGFAESQITWTYRFRDGRLAEAGWSPRRGR
jgi:ketosteroid isomerase-like protein